MPGNAGGGEPVADREFVITRVFEAPARLLFEATSKREHLGGGHEIGIHSALDQLVDAVAGMRASEPS